MKLYVNGQDIRVLVLADLDDSESPVRYLVSPEQFLFSIDQFLQSRGIHKEDLEQIVLVQGPGSATSLRSIFSITQALAWALGIPLCGVKKEMDEKDEFLLGRLRANEEQIFTGSQVVPVYQHQARITSSNKDSLKRKKK